MAFAGNQSRRRGGYRCGNDIQEHGLEHDIGKIAYGHFARRRGPNEFIHSASAQRFSLGSAISFISLNLVHPRRISHSDAPDPKHLLARQPGLGCCHLSQTPPTSAAGTATTSQALGAQTRWSPGLKLDRPSSLRRRMGKERPSIWCATRWRSATSPAASTCLRTR